MDEAGLAEIIKKLNLDENTTWATMDPKILRLIFSKVQEGDMDAVKSVCKQWKGAAASTPGTGASGGAGDAAGGSSSQQSN